MSFQAQLQNIKTKTGKSADELKAIAAQKGSTRNGLLIPGVKAGDVIKWLKDDFGLGHGHAMAIYAWLNGLKKEGD